MTTLYVQFTDAAETEINSVFSCKQDADAYDNQGEVDSSDTRYSTYYSALPASAQAHLVVPG